MKHASRLSIALFITFALLGALTAGAAEINVSSGLLVWQNAGPSVGHQLTVSGKGGVIVRDFAAGETPSFNAFDDEGNSLVDGSYTWQLRSIPELGDAERRAIQGLRDAGKRPTAAQMPQSEVTWGYVSMAGGAFVGHQEEEFETQTKQVEGPTQRAQVFATDLIVQGSACVGFDCTSSESFGFDTLRLKENNLRIKFQDTSASASFPSNDWQLTANDSSNGGADKFAIDDITGGKTPFTIEAGAPSHSLYVDDAGNVGVNTSTPVVEMHIVDGDSPTFRLEQNGSSGFTPQTWDIAGNETNFFVRDVTNGSKLPFKIKPSAPDNALFVSASGNIGINEDSPDARLHIKGSTTTESDIYLESTDGAAKTWRLRNTPANGRLTFNDVGGNVPFKFAAGAQDNLLRIGIADTGTGGSTDSASTVTIGSAATGEDAAVLAVYGSIRVDGTQVHADYVFQPEYDLPSIEDHAEFMWTESHLPGLPKAPAGNIGTVDITEHQMGMLEELETAHIYIERLNKTVQALQERLEALEESND
jgi:hypothetical protein